MGFLYRGPFKPRAIVYDTSGLAGSGSFFTVKSCSVTRIGEIKHTLGGRGLAPPPVPFGEVGTAGPKPRLHTRILEESVEVTLTGWKPGGKWPGAGRHA